MSKVFEKEVFRQVYGYLTENCMLSKFQSGFRPKHCTVTALIQMCDEWLENMDNGKLNGVVFLDIKKAFDSINHGILLNKMKKRFGISSIELKWFESYLSRENERTERESQGVGRDMSCPRKLFLEERKPEVCLPRRPHAVLSRSQVLSEKRKWRRTWKADEEIFIMSFQNACGRLGRQTSARTKTSARLKITFVDMTYPKGWTGSLPLCPLIFSCICLIESSNAVLMNNYHPRKQSPAASLRVQSWVHCCSYYILMTCLSV